MTAASRPTIRTSPKATWSASTSSSAATAAARRGSTATSSRTTSPNSSGPSATACSPSRGHPPASSPGSRPSRRPTSRAIRPQRCARRHRRHQRPARRARARPQAQRTRQGRRAPSASRSIIARRPIPLSRPRADAREFRLPRHRRAHLHRRAATAWPSASSTTWCSTSRGDVAAIAARRRPHRGRHPCRLAERCRERRLQPADRHRRACTGTMSRCCAPCRAICARSASAYSQHYLASVLTAIPTSRWRWSRCSTPCTIPNFTGNRERSALEARDAIAARSRPPSRSTKTASSAASSTWSMRASRTNFYQRDADGAPPPGARDQVRLPQGRRPARAQAATRDLRLFAARRGRASALRRHRARRPALVGPAGGFPHRGAGPGQGAAGQERHHRAGRRQGRLRAQADAGRRRPRGGAGGRHRLLQDLRLDPARRHRQSRRRHVCSAARCPSAATATIPIWSSPPTRARPPSPTPPTPSPSNAVSGSATPSPPAVRSATTTRRWASPRAAPGKRSSAISAKSTATSSPSPSPSPASATCRGDVFGNGMLLSREDPPGRRLRSSRHLHRSRSRPGKVARRAPAPVRPAALELAGLRQGSALEGRRRLFRARSRIVALFQEARRALGLGNEPVTPAGSDAAPSSRPKSTCSGSAASAPMCAPATKPTPRPATRPMTPSASPARTSAPRSSAKGANLGVTQRGRIEFARAWRPHQHRRHRQFGRRQFLRPRGQYQDRARQPRPARQPRHGAAQRVPRLDDRRGCGPCLRNNYLQTLAISLAQRGGPPLLIIAP